MQDLLGHVLTRKHISQKRGRAAPDAIALPRLDGVLKRLGGAFPYNATGLYAMLFEIW
jgi:hypothetical protein